MVREDRAVKKCGEIFPVDIFLLCNPKPFVFPWKTNSITVKKKKINKGRADSGVSDKSTDRLLLIYVKFSQGDFCSMTLEHEATDPNERFPKCSTVLSFASLKRKQIYLGLLPCQRKLVQSCCFLIGASYCLQLLGITKNTLDLLLVDTDSVSFQENGACFF